MLFVINTLGLALLLPYSYLSLFPIYAELFVIGRVVFWVGYRHHVLSRPPGFSLTVLPALVGLSYCCAVILVRTVELWL